MEEKCLDANYITISTGYDDMNVKVAMDVRRFYMDINRLHLKLVKKYETKPLINVYIENDLYLESVKNLLKEDNYQICAFGSNKEFYSYALVVNSDVERLAINSSRVYEAINSNHNDAEKTTAAKAISDFYGKNELERNSNRTNAIHLLYKLYRYGFGIIEKKHATQKQILVAPALLEQLKEKLSDENVMDNLACIEHDRWNALYRTEGWSGIPYDRWNSFYKEYNSQKNYLLKQHACICPYGKLEEAEHVFLKNGEKNEFRKYDYDYIKNLTKTLGLEKDDTSEINVSGVDYILVKI